MGKTELRLEIDAELLAQARAAEIQLNLTMEHALREQLGPRAGDIRARKWAEENAAAIASHNQYVEEHGAFGSEWRSW